MKGEIILSPSGQSVACNVIDCYGMANFRWFYRGGGDGASLNVLNGENIVPFVGYGQYVCEVDCLDAKLIIEKTFVNGFEVIRRDVDFTPYEVVEPRAMPEYAWDFTRIPDSEVANIRALVKAESWKELILLHNKYDLSHGSKICCDTDMTKIKFNEYVKNLSAGAGEVVPNTKSKNARISSRK